MAKIVLGLVAAIACFVLAESLTCNSCGVDIFGLCLGTATTTCSNTSVCYYSKASFPKVGSFKGFSGYGCIETAQCPSNSTTNNGTLPVLNLDYTVSTTCCSTDKCNTVTVSGAPSTKMTLSVALSAAAMAALWGSFM